MFFEFGNNEVPLKEALAFIRKLVTAKQQVIKKEEQSYETVCNTFQQASISSRGKDSEAINALTTMVKNQEKTLSTLNNIIQNKDAEKGPQVNEQKPQPSQQQRPSRQQSRFRPPERNKSPFQQRQGNPQLNGQRRVCFQCHKPGHIQRDCWYSQNRKRGRTDERTRDQMPDKREQTPYYENRRRSQSRYRHYSKDSREENGYERRRENDENRRPRYRADWREYDRQPSTSRNYYPERGYRDSSYTRYREPEYQRDRSQPPQNQGYRQQSQERIPKQLPSKSGHPDDVRTKKTPMNAMPVERVPLKQTKQHVIAAADDGDYENVNYMGI